MLDIAGRYFQWYIHKLLLSEIIRTRVHVLCILATATSWGRHLFQSEFPIVQLLLFESGNYSRYVTCKCCACMLASVNACWHRAMKLHPKLQLIGSRVTMVILPICVVCSWPASQPLQFGSALYTGRFYSNTTLPMLPPTVQLIGG